MNYKEMFQEAFDLIESMKPYTSNMPIEIKNEIVAFLKKHSEEIYGIKNYLDE
jgi:hypothetical protein